MLKCFALLLGMAPAASACSDALEQGTTAGQFIVVANVDADTLSLVSASNFTSSDVSLVNFIGKNPISSPSACTAIFSEL